MMAEIMDVLFGCWHSNYSFPLIVRKGSKDTYVVCLDCGKEFEYDWKAMKVRGPLAQRVASKQIAQYEEIPVMVVAK